MTEMHDFAPAIAACFDYDPDNPLDRRALEEEIRTLFAQSEAPTRDELISQDRRLQQMTRHRRIALVYGGATKIKGYVFEAPKLPEIRGASALLDWVNEGELPRLWGTQSPDEFVEKGIIYASGGNILAFAPADKGQELATAIEHCYTESTLTANSVAVGETFSLLELRYGRLRTNPRTQNLYWVEDFLEDCQFDQKWTALTAYYYPPEGVAPDDRSSEALRQRFLNRKTFGELVTVLATKFNRRRDELAYAGEPRSVPFYPILPWAEKCDSSDIRPAVISETINDEQRQMSAASARKRYVGQRVKKSALPKDWFHRNFDWEIPESLEERSWEKQWEDNLKKHPRSCYAQAVADSGVKLIDIHPPQDIGEISQASSPGRYIGVIYADGNNVGRLIATLRAPQNYHETSNILRDAAKQAVFKALADYLVPALVRSERGDSRWIHPFEILAIGGDDLFLIVPGSLAFDIALAIGYNFEAKLAKKLPPVNQAVASDSFMQRYGAETLLQTAPYTPSIGLSAGVIIAQENAPIFFLRDLVEELLKKAKDRAKQNASNHYYSGAVDFMVLKSITMVTDSIKAFRKAALGDQGKESTRRLTARPYTWHEFAGLLATIRALKQAHTPRSQLYRLRRVLDADASPGIITSVMEYLYTRARLRGAPAAQLMTYIEHYWCHGPTFAGGRKGMPPWLPLGDTDAWETIWPDLLEAYDMVPEVGPEAAYALVPEDEQEQP